MEDNEKRITVLLAQGDEYYVNHQTNKAIECYLRASELNSNKAISWLCTYYSKKKDWDSLKKMALLAVEKGNEPEYVCEGAQHLGDYYYEIKDYDNMEKYYLLAYDNRFNSDGEIEEVNKDILFILGSRYEANECIDKMHLYYLKAIQDGSVEAMISLARYYCDHKKYDKLLELRHHIKNNQQKIEIDSALRWLRSTELIKLIDKRDKTINALADEIIQLKAQIKDKDNIIQKKEAYITELEYMPYPGPKYLETKQDFDNKKRKTDGFS